MFKGQPDKGKSSNTSRSGGGTVLDKPRVKPKKRLDGGGASPPKPPKIGGGGGDDDAPEPSDKRRITDEEKFALKGMFAKDALMKVLPPVEAAEMRQSLLG